MTDDDIKKALADAQRYEGGLKQGSGAHITAIARVVRLVPALVERCERAERRDGLCSCACHSVAGHPTYVEMTEMVVAAKKDTCAERQRAEEIADYVRLQNEHCMRQLQNTEVERDELRQRADTAEAALREAQANPMTRLNNLVSSLQYCDDCQQPACDEAKPEGPHTLCHDCAVRHKALTADRDRLRALVREVAQSSTRSSCVQWHREVTISDAVWAAIQQEASDE